MTTETHIRRSPLYRQHREMGAEFAERGGAEVVTRYGGEGESLPPLAVADFTMLGRTGIKGRDTMPALAEAGLQVGEESNRCYRQENGDLVLKLAPSEVIVLPGGEGGPAEIALNGKDGDKGGERLCFIVPRQESSFWFRLVGAEADACMAKLCGVDLRPKAFADHAIAQTSMARMNAVIARDDHDGQLAYHILGDIASSNYLWGVLLDAIEEFGGRAVGLDTLQSEATEKTAKAV